jgi:hypothetical protein
MLCGECGRDVPAGEWFLAGGDHHVTVVEPGVVEHVGAGFMGSVRLVPTTCMAVAYRMRYRA